MSPATPPPLPDTQTKLQETLLAALEGQIDLPRKTLFYKIGLLLVALTNLLLPLVYLGLLFLVAHAVYWHARYNRPGTSRFEMTLYLLVYLAGGMTLFFLIKPLFSKDREASTPLILKRSAEPFLFEYIDKLCKALKAPRPSSIILICEPNAYASFSQGPWGFLTRKMTLAIGLPLVSGFTVGELTGVLAHELGHFSQGTGMRLSYLVRHINQWLLKIVFLRDRWDEHLEAWSQSSAPHVWIFAKMIRFLIRLSRLLLFGLLWIGNAISCFLMRQMEFDADLYEVRTVGRRISTRSFSRITDLNVGFQLAMQDLRQFHSEGRLADDLPALAADNVARITPEIRKRIRKAQQEETPGLFDTHPSDQQRLENISDEDETGLYHLPPGAKDPPATVLFTQFERICRRMTVDFYEKLMGDDFKKKMLHPVGKLIASRKAEQEAGKTLDRYFQIHVPIDRPLPLDEDTLSPPAKPREALHLLRDAREEMLGELKDYRDLPERYDHAKQVMYSTVELMGLLELGFDLKPEEVGIGDGSKKAVREKHDRAQVAIKQLATKMLVFESAASTRLATALQLLQVPKVAHAIGGGEEMQIEIREIIRHARKISGIISGLPSFRMQYRKLAILFSRLGKRPSRRKVRTLIEQMMGIHKRMQTIHDELLDERYPFDHSDDSMTLQKFVLPVVPHPADLQGLVIMTEYMVERLFTLQIRLFSRLTQAAERVESTFGLEPLPDVKEKSTVQ